MALIPKLKAVAPNETLTAIALRFCLAHDVVATVVPGASRLSQLIENVAAQSVTLSNEQITALKQLTKQTIFTAHR